MLYLRDSLKQLQNLQYLELSLFDNKIGENEMNVKYLAEGIKSLSLNLQNLKLYLSGCNLGGNVENMKYLEGCMK